MTLDIIIIKEFTTGQGTQVRETLRKFSLKRGVWCFFFKYHRLYFNIEVENITD